jgi:predicted RND superfamily exporter protein
MTAQWLRGLSDDIYCQIGLVMLIGLASKNAILIVEFAKQRREEGMPVQEAAMTAALIRLRPILMTAFAFILGVFPLVVASGAGANSRHSLGTAVFGGMIVSTLLSLIIVPVFVIIENLKRGPQARLMREPAPERSYFPVLLPEWQRVTRSSPFLANISTRGMFVVLYAAPPTSKSPRLLLHRESALPWGCLFVRKLLRLFLRLYLSLVPGGFGLSITPFIAY